MADKRMFSKNIIESDPFMEMPAEAQMLYIHLSMAADDDGFVDKPRTIMRSCGASNDSMKLLIAKKFVIAFERSDNFLVVIKHWRLNNYIRKDTYRETKYRDFMRELYYDENRSYSLNPGDGHYPCLTNHFEELPSAPSRDCDCAVTEPSRDCDEPSTQYRLDKDSVGKEREGEYREEENNNNSLTHSFTREEKEKKLRDMGMMLRGFTERGWDTAGCYRLSESYGFTREEVEEAARQLAQESGT